MEKGRSTQDFGKFFTETFCENLSFGVTYIKRMVHVVTNGLIAYFQENWETSILKPTDLQRLEHLAVSVYLGTWLENDKNAAQNIHYFASRKYMLNSERSNLWGRLVFTNDRLSELRRATYILCGMNDLQEKQSAVELTGVYTSNQSGDESTHSIPYDFISLRFLDLYARRKLLLFELLTLRKKIMQITSQKKEPYRPIIDAYHEYGSIFEEMKSYKDSNAREYVAACIQMQKMESTYRFQLCAEIAKYIADNNLDHKQVIERLRSEEARVCWERYFVPRILTDVDVMTSHSYDILNYAQEIECVFEGDELTAWKTIVFRSLLMNVIDIMHHVANPITQRSWTDDDFKEAAAFFKKDYPIFENGTPSIIKEIEITTKSSAFIHYIREIYELLAGNKEMPLYSFRTQMQQMRKDHNTRKSKK